VNLLSYSKATSTASDLQVNVPEAVLAFPAVALQLEGEQLICCTHLDKVV
jgi:hypothetical protein